MYSIKINNKQLDVFLTKQETTRGIIILVTVFDDKESFSSKLICNSIVSNDYARVSKLTDHELFDEAFNQFSKHYPFDQIEEAIKSGLVILLPW